MSAANCVSPMSFADHEKALSDYENEVCNPPGTYPKNLCHYANFKRLNDEIREGCDPALLKLLAGWTCMRLVSYQQMRDLAHKAGTGIPTIPGTHIPDESTW